MITSSPPRLRAGLIALLFLGLGVGMTGVGLAQVASSPASPLLMLWVTLILAGAPLGLWAAYHFYGLVTAEYRLDRNCFALAWGGVREVLPLDSIQRLEEVTSEDLPAAAGLSPPGTWLGVGALHGSPVEFFATAQNRLVVVGTAERALVISPADPAAFEEAFVQATRLGSLQRVKPVSERPDLLPARLWSDRLARMLLLAGLVVSLALLGYLAFRAASLPAAVPFGFTAQGAPGPPAPPGRLLLLPLIGGLVWLTDLLFGGYLYRRPSGRPYAYALWALALLVGALLWGASLKMLAAAT